MQVTVLEIGSVTEEKKGRNSWYTLPVKYRDDRGGEKEKKFKSFDKLWPQIKEMEVGKTYDVQVKKEGDFWNWVNISEVQGGGTSSSGTSPRNNGVSVNRDWETKEERAIRQKLITSQSSVTAAIEIFKLLEEKPGSVEEIFDLAKRVQDFHFNGSDSQKEPEVD